MGAHGEASTTLDLLCLASGAAVSLFSLWATIRWWWWNRALGQGVRRAEPTIAALVCNAAWFVYAWTGTGKAAEETLRVNGCCGAVQTLSLLTFLALCTHEERAHAVIPLAGATVFLGVAISMGLMRTGVDDVSFKKLCAFAGSVAASAPLLTFTFLAESWTADMLPQWFVSCVSMVHGGLWFSRGMGKVPSDYYMATQNALGSTCSFLLLVLMLMFVLRRARPPTQDAPPTQHEQDMRASLLAIAVATPAPPTEHEQDMQASLLAIDVATPAPPTQNASTSDEPRRSERIAKAQLKNILAIEAATPAPPTQNASTSDEPRRSERIAKAQLKNNAQDKNTRSPRFLNATPTSDASQDPAATPSRNRPPPRKFVPRRSTSTSGNQLAPARTASRSDKGKQPVSAGIQDSSSAGPGRKARKPRGSQKRAAPGGDERSAKKTKKAGV